MSFSPESCPSSPMTIQHQQMIWPRWMVQLQQTVKQTVLFHWMLQQRLRCCTVYVLTAEFSG